MSAQRIRRLIRIGAWKQIYPGVFIVGGAPETWETRIVAATLGAGSKAAASHRSAARWLGLDGFRDDLIEITSSRCVRWRGVVAHRGPALNPRDTMRLKGLRVTTGTRTLADLSGVVSLPRLEAALDSALVKGLTSIRHLDRHLAEARSRRGTVPLRRLVESRRGQAPTESELERAFCRKVISKFDIPLPERQFEIRIGDSRARIDFAYPSLHIGIEVLGWRFHQGKTVWERDLARHNRLTAAGWTLLYFTWSDVMERPDWVASEIRRHLGDQQTLFVNKKNP